MKKLLRAGVLVFSLSVFSFATKAQTGAEFLIENFNAAYATLNHPLPAGWIDSNLSEPTDPSHLVGLWIVGPDSPSTKSLHGHLNTDPFNSTDGFLFINADSCLNVPRTNAAAVKIDNWVFTPLVRMKQGSQLQFYISGNPDASGGPFPDSVQAYYCVGDTTDTTQFRPFSLTANMPTNFTLWTLISTSLSDPLTDTFGRLAFRYHITGGPTVLFNAQFVAIDDINYNSHPLPVNLSSFTGRADKNNNVNLQWETASESNNDHFEIERSIDGKNFDLVGKVKALGRTTTLSNVYGYTDATASATGVNKILYRLKQVDINSHYGYSPVITATLTNTGVSNFLNASLSGSTLKANFWVETGGIANISVYTANGQLISHNTQETTTGKNLYSQEMNSLAPGIYIIKVACNNETMVNRFVR